MKYSTSWLIDICGREESVKYIFFWGHQPSRDGSINSSCFSQWFNAPVLVDGIIYPTSEHWMMAQKALLFKDENTFHKIISSKSPGEAKELGRQVDNFNLAIWEQKRYQIVLEGSLHKFGQHSRLREFLLNTKQRILVEASPVDTIWGIGLTAESHGARYPELWAGKNLLGFALMEARDILSQEL
ncbi:NADAR family protein [Dyadobacter psychrotolerans]|uniref:NADAR family protein n=1 Tax=Dyadobacter psychrotolerans TaxID=2541721 RepID=A0A4R5DMB2_9BACT|nr:NADAR family protein [Dyadobacter psychrotolerans]TDE14627.1 NADAR family protein [Dyadobacter psychrotolerans]